MISISKLVHAFYNLEAYYLEGFMAVSQIEILLLHQLPVGKKYRQKTSQSVDFKHCYGLNYIFSKSVC